MQPLKLYSYVDKLAWPRSYSGRLLLITFIGIHIPLLGIILYLIPSGTLFGQNLPVLLAALAATLIGTALTLWVLSQLLEPVKLCSSALMQYGETKQRPNLPTNFNDEAGQLMANLQVNISQLDDVLNLKSKLLAILSHDARSPLNTILMARELMAQQLNEPPLDVEALREYCDIIEMGATHQLELLNNILTLTRLDSDDEKMHREEVSLDQLLQNIQHHNKLQLEAKNLSFSYQVEPGDIQLMLDAVKLKSVLNNLVQNAIKFTPNGGAIEIRAEKTGGAIKIKVSDTGEGIRPEVKPYLFKPGVESTRDGTQQEKGNGLGLWICKTFTELIGGSISYKSKPQEGTTFILSFDDEKVRAA